MKRHTAFRITAITFASIAILSLSAWCVSARWTIFRMAQFGDSVTLKGGTVSYLWTNTAIRQRLIATGLPATLKWEWHAAGRRSDMEWLPPPYAASPSGRAIIVIVLWPIILSSSAAAFAFWRLSLRRPHPDACPRCGYRLTGLSAATPCPECGSAAKSKG